MTSPKLSPETAARLHTLIRMLSTQRPHGSWADREFCDYWIATLPRAWQDSNRNWHVDVQRAGSPASRVLWTCHTDTMHRMPGKQQVQRTGNILKLAGNQSRANCLGADDTAGVFLAHEMILAGVPGHYIFHYGEEVGCVGSRGLADESPEFLSNFTYAIALDRGGVRDVVTYQLGSRCCSDAFALSLAAQLPGPYGPARGVYTDTAEYTHLVPECTNISVGYYMQHSRAETLDAAHLFTLLDSLFVFDESLLVCARDCWDEDDEDEDERAKSINGQEISDAGRDGWPLWSKQSDTHAPHTDTNGEDLLLMSEDDKRFYLYLKGM